MEMMWTNGAKLIRRKVYLTRLENNEDKLELARMCMDEGPENDPPDPETA